MKMNRWIASRNLECSFESFYIEEGNSTGLANISKLKYEAFFLMLLIMVHKIFFSL